MSITRYDTTPMASIQCTGPYCIVGVNLRPHLLPKHVRNACLFKKYTNSIHSILVSYSLPLPLNWHFKPYYYTYYFIHLPAHPCSIDVQRPHKPEINILNISCSPAPGGTSNLDYSNTTWVVIINYFSKLSPAAEGNNTITHKILWPNQLLMNRAILKSRVSLLHTLPHTLLHTLPHASVSHSSFGLLLKMSTWVAVLTFILPIWNMKVRNFVAIAY